jgi:molybdate transport system substrate-binding protein
MKRALALLALVLVAGCGSGGSSSSSSHPQLIVSAASSLKDALTNYGSEFKPATVRLSFAGSDELAAQIRAGGKADVFASANTKLPNQLFSEGKVERPVKFTANRLVLAVPARGGNVNSLDDLVKPGVKVAIGAPSVPIGSYTRQVLAGLPAIERNRILANVKTQEPDVTGIVGKLTQGAVDAGFVYITDVRATKGALKAIQLPPKLQPTVVYEAAVVKGTTHEPQAKAFVAGLAHGEGQTALRQAGFLPVP